MIVFGFTKRRVWFVEFANVVNVLNNNRILIWKTNLLYSYDLINKWLYSYIDVTFRLCVTWLEVPGILLLVTVTIFTSFFLDKHLVLLRNRLLCRIVVAAPGSKEHGFKAWRTHGMNNILEEAFFSTSDLVRFTQWK